ncbi:hypothetical protein CC1G_01119 [Coprinopsis cinerea okayama7|uniref:Uncharacterized protein n=1 Tax=Coprinopsis cinerea (strain Okayama-7 / 130 / ATCC MYA-4618 / FGSC 9003) TaxID=240176 RepID=A8NEK5_COPC7|nr:hypothetical protein CC1G_01119 [Coprinopsis cinerea okayama7\|eukprot:XP_001833057.1 hypothetical protein CC1G_01119 [Coprinopsis cinerea okayama7\
MPAPPTQLDSDFEPWCPPEPVMPHRPFLQSQNGQAGHPVTNAKPSCPPLGTAIQKSADIFMHLLNREVAQAVSYERAKTLEIHNASNAQQENRTAQHAQEKQQLEAKVAYLTRQLELAHAQLRRQSEQLQRQSSDASAAERAATAQEIKDLEAQNDSLRAACDRLHSNNQTLSNEASMALTHLGIYLPKPDTYCFGNHWPELLTELGIDPTRPWTATDLNNCVRHMAHTLRQQRQPHQANPTLSIRQ